MAHKFLNNFYTMTTAGAFTTKKFFLEEYVTGKTYYLDAIKGSDAGDGSEFSPWQTLAKAQASIAEGDCVVLRDGNYGEFTDSPYTADRTGWNVFIAETDTNPVISNISMFNSSSPFDLRLAFYGIRFEPDYVDPGILDPYDPNSGEPGYTYNKSATPVRIDYRNYIEFYNCIITGYAKHLTEEAFYVTHSSNIKLQRCELALADRLITFIACDDLVISYNYMHNSTASFITDGNNGGNESHGVVIEGNHCHDMNWNFSQPYCPRAPGRTPHGSLIAVESPDMIIRGNFLHDGGATAGITFYTDGTTVFSNILIENNVVYDVHNNFALDINDIGENVVVRNNTISARGYYGYDNEYKYYIAMIHTNNFPGYSGGLSVYNNIFIGGVVYGEGIADVNEGNNLYWCASPSGTFTSFYKESDLTNSKIKLSIDADFFDTGLFEDDFDRSWYYWDVDPLMWNLETLASPGNQKILDLKLQNDAEGINFGDSVNQPTDSLGSLDKDRKFLNPDGAIRDANNHDAGAYQRIVKKIVPVDINYEIPELGDVKPVTKLGGSDISKFVPNVNMSFRFGGSEEFYININSKKVITDEKAVLTNGILTQKVGTEIDEFRVDDKGHFKWDTIFESMPASMIIEYDIQYSPGIKFEYQPALTFEERKKGTIRLDDVVGSYAVFCNKAFNEHKTGKICHIYRPFVVDAEGNYEWCNLSIVENTLIITLPVTFMSTAIYPVRLDPDFGVTSVGGSWDFWYDIMAIESPDTPGSNGELTSMSIYCRTASAGKYARLALYSDDSGDPDSRLGYNDTGTLVTDDYTGRWIDCTVSYAGITSGTQYHLAVDMSDGNNFEFAYDTVADAMAYDSVASGSFPTTFTVSGNRSQQISIYGTYTESGGGGVAHGGIQCKALSGSLGGRGV